jgi:hypothetical protein
MSPTNPEPPAGATGGFLAGRGVPAAALAFLLFTLYLFSVALVPIRADNDCWWHVKTGQYIVQHGIPSHDVLAYTAADHPWHNHEWLSQVLFYGAWKLGEDSGFDGWRGVVLFTAIILWLTYGCVFLLGLRLSRNAWIALLIAVLGVAIGRRMFYPRPPVITNLMLMLEITLLLGVSEGWFRRGWLWVLVPFIALWTNLHGGWMAGGVILAAWMLEQGLANLRDRLPRLPLAAATVVPPLRQLFPLGALSLAATLANPFTYHLYALPGRVMGDPELVASIGELASPNFYFVIDFELAILAGFFLALLVGRRLRPRLWEILIALFFLHQAIQHVRHLFLFSVTMAPLYIRLVAAAVEATSESLAGWRPHPVLARVPALAVLAVALGLGSWVLINPREGGQWTRPLTPASYPGRNFQYLAGAGYLRDRYPSLVCDFIELAELKGNMFNENFYAGYLIWRLSPEEHRVFSDSRFDIFGSRFLKKENIIAAGGEGQIDGRTVTWQGLLDEYDVQWAITRTGTGLGAAMGESKGAWAPAAMWPEQLGRWEIWIRNTPQNAEMIGRARATAPMAGASSPQ